MSAERSIGAALEDGILWLDVTDLMTWRGNLTGIQRAQFHLGLEFSRESNVKFFAATYSGSIKEVPLPTTESFFQVDKKSRLRGVSTRTSIFTRGINFFGRSLQRILPTRLIRLQTRIRNSVKTNWADLRFSLRTRRDVSEAIEHPFSPNDTVLTLSATWGRSGFPEMLCTLRNQVGFRFISTVFDLIPIYAPHFFGDGFGNHFARYLMNTVQASDALLSISQSTTRDLERFMLDVNIPSTPVINFRLGDDPLSIVGEHSPRPEIKSGDYILVVGTVEVRKNHQVLYQAWELARKRGIKLPQLVIVGRPGWNVNDLLYSISANPLVADKISIISGIADAELGWLYANCILTVYPSWYEGWGLPVAESLHFGKLCISSDASSMPEIGGDLVEYCSPYEPAAFLEKIVHFTTNRDALKAAERKIAGSYTSVTWHETYLEIKQGLEQLTREKS